MANGNHHDQHSLQKDMENLKGVIDMTKQAITSLNNRFAGQDPPPIFYESYREFQDSLANLQEELDMKRDQLQDLQESDRRAVENATTSQPNRPITPVPPTPQPSQPTTTTTTTSGFKDTRIRLLLPNGKSTVKATEGKTLKDIVLSSSRLKIFRDNPDRISLFILGTKQEIDLNTNSMDFCGMELELKTVDEKYKDSTRILQARHNFIKKTFFALCYCDNCEKRLMYGVTCKMCGFKLHQKCKQEVQDYCITSQQISEIEKIIGPSTKNPSKDGDESGKCTDQQQFDDETRQPYPRKRAISQPILHVQGIAALHQQQPADGADPTSTTKYSGGGELMRMINKMSHRGSASLEDLVSFYQDQQMVSTFKLLVGAGKASYTRRHRPSVTSPFIHRRSGQQQHGHNQSGFSRRRFSAGREDCGLFTSCSPRLRSLCAL